MIHRLLNKILIKIEGVEYKHANWEKVLDNLPLKSTLSEPPWSDTYWPSFLSGIAHRWQLDHGSLPGPQDFNYKLLSKAQLLAMDVDEIAQTLSPAEKFDVVNSRFDYPTVKSEWQRTAPTDAKWEGLCHGWAPASLYYHEVVFVILCFIFDRCIIYQLFLLSLLARVFDYLIFS